MPADATPFIYLAKADAFALAPACGMLLIATPAVWRESVDECEPAEYADAATIRVAEEAGWIRRAGLTEAQARTASQLGSMHRLGQGESETLAIAQPRSRVLVDDGRASRVAEALGLEPISTLFLPLLAVRARRLGGTEAKEQLRALARVANARAEAVIELERLIEKEGAA